MKKSLDSFNQSKYLSIKHSNYFSVYDELLTNFIDTEIIFVEIGVLNGGSLFMWRDFLGPKATIIGVDSNPDAKKWAKDGFIIEIGDQSDPIFWDYFFSKFPKIDVLLDDGGHTNKQQIITTLKSVGHVSNGGLIIIEDAHCSYLPEFGNPHQYSFINFSKMLVDVINSRFPKVKKSENIFVQKVSKISFYESIVAIHINDELCIMNTPISNYGITSNAVDMRKYKDTNVYRKLQTISTDHIPTIVKNIIRLWIERYIFLKRFFFNYRLKNLFIKK